MELSNVNRYVIEPVDHIHLIDVNTGAYFTAMGHRVRDLETQEFTPGLMMLEDALTLVLHMDKTQELLPDLED